MTILSIIFYVLCALFIAPAQYFGGLKVIKNDKKVTDFTRWGFPMWFMQGLGLTEMGASIGLLFPQTRLVCIAIYGVILIGAIYINLNYKEDDLIPAVGVLVLLMVILGMSLWVI
jgi:DoxX-like family